MELLSFREKFGDIYWNETENVIFIPVEEYISQHHVSAILKFYNFFSEVDRDVKGVYINCGEL